MKQQNVDFKNLIIKLEAANTKIAVARSVPISAKTAIFLSVYYLKHRIYAKNIYHIFCVNQLDINENLYKFYQ